ncbi:hypothetical protein D1007_58066 [Hordeum vulgare]|nr:hypothetical protein D1007_58066 [Hordeum vulgare]
MDDVTAAPKRGTRTRYVPHELVTQILLHLPVESLLRLTCVCKAWEDTITGDRSFHREHARVQEPCVLIAPRLKLYDAGRPFSITGMVTTPGLGQDAGTLAQAMDSFFFPTQEASRRHDLAHCDSLVLVVSGDDTVRVVNPATHLTLPLPRGYVTAAALHRCFHGALGLGHDPRSNTYKVARIYYRSVHMPGTGGCIYTLTMEVFSVHHRQRSTALASDDGATTIPYHRMSDSNLLQRLLAVDNR